MGLLRLDRAVVLLGLVLLAGGCATTSGTVAAVTPEDQLITLKVKARLLRTFSAPIAALSVDTYEGVVYLSGTVKTRAQKELAEEAAWRVKNVDLVVSNVAVRGEGTEAALARPEQARGDERPALVASFGKIKRLDLITGTPGWTRYAAFDSAGRQVATVYAVSASQLSEIGVDSLPNADRPIDHVSILPMPGSDEYQVVLWHVSLDEAAALH
ncbi:MAG: BON domain-containing protein [Candidatus Rokubacteria bacterium]|nr:BON domain-containing protein [Candidatus Rokubacteria bacterium]